MKKLLVFIWLSFLFCCIGFLFWQNDVKYHLPTPIPVSYQAVLPGTYIDLPNEYSGRTGLPVFIHFFNPDCPCSRFNMPHFQSLVKSYQDKMNFVIVVINRNKQYTVKEIQDKYDLGLPVFFDTSIARICGVYSTPQAVILDAAHNLFYRGNYNKSRYCTDVGTNFAQIAIDSLLGNNARPLFGELAFKAYGCELPNCKK